MISIMAINVTILCNLLFSETVLNLFKTYVLNNTWRVKLLLCIAVLVIYAFVIFGVYSFNIFILEKKSFVQAYKKSMQMVKKNFLGTLLSLVLYNLAILVLIGVFYVLISLILVAGVKILDMAYIGSVVYLSALKYVRTGTKIFLFYIAIPASYTVISRMYYKYTKEEDINYSVIHIREKFFKLNRVVYFALLVGSIVLNISYAVFAFNRNPFDKVAIFHVTNVTAHRGASVYAPENTLSAFSRAIEEMADYIELDVQQTKDGAIVVMHDSSAYRTTGVDRRIGDMTLEEVKTLDAGSSFSREFAGEKVPTLDEVLELVNGRAMLNVEIKTNSTDQNIAKEVVDIIQKHDASEDCVITSFNYSVLKQVKALDDTIEVGYILSVAYGDFYSTDDVDFFSMNASFLSKRLVDAIHNSGKEVYAWTVNNETSIRNLTNKGVDNIITDNPKLARETIYSRDTSETLTNMIKYVFNR
jgi:glycerophosphoryl diester phosphodiesterase